MKKSDGMSRRLQQKIKILKSIPKEMKKKTNNKNNDEQ